MIQNAPAHEFPGSDVSVRNTWIFRGLLAVAIGLASYAISQWVFVGMPLTTDENSYVFQAYAFRDGVIARPAPPLHGCFTHEMIIQDEKAGWLSRYPPGHSLWLLPGALFDAPRLMIALAAALSFWMLSGCAALLRIPKGAIPILLCCSPYFLFMHGTLLSHTSGMLAVAVMLWSYLSWVLTRRSRYAAFAGLIWSFLFLNRTYTALLLALPFAVDVLWRACRERNRTVWIDTIVFALCSSLGILLFLLYNRLAVGDAFASTYLFYDASENLGFGLRHINCGLAYDHTLQRGLRLLTENVCLLDKWLFGFSGSLIALLVLFFLGWSARWSLLLLSSILVVWLGYIFFFYPGYNTIGPFYYFETLPMMVVGGGLGISRLWQGAASWPRTRQFGAWFAVLLMAIMSIAFMWREGMKIRADRMPKARLMKLIKSVPPNSLVILEDIPEPDMGELVFNLRGLKSDPLVLHSCHGFNRMLAKCFPERIPYLLKGNNAIPLSPLDLNKPAVLNIIAAYTLFQTGQNERCFDGKKEAVRVAREGRDRAMFLAMGGYYDIFPGRFRVRFDISLTGCASNAPVVVDVATDNGRRILAHKELHGNIGREIHDLEIISDDFISIEPRVYYGGSGNIWAHTIQIKEVFFNPKISSTPKGKLR